MKYLKKFNENVIKKMLETTVDKKELKNFCEDYLANLRDDNFVSIVQEQRDRFDIWIEKENLDEDEENDDFKFNDVKDSYIPFLNMLANKYILHSSADDEYSIYVSFVDHFDDNSFSINTIENINENYDINYIIVSIKKYTT